MGVIILIVLLCIEAFFLMWAIFTKNNHHEEKSIVSIAELLLVGVLLVTGILEWGFRYFTRFLVLNILAVNGATILLRLRKKHETYKLSRSILHFASYVFLFAFSLFPVILCPQYEQPQITGNYAVANAKYTSTRCWAKNWVLKTETSSLTIRHILCRFSIFTANFFMTEQPQ